MPSFQFRNSVTALRRSSVKIFSLFLLMSLPTLKADDVTVFAAISLSDALKEIATNYMKTSSDHISFSFNSSSALEVQIKAGAPADIFFSADEAKMNDLEKLGLIAKDTRKDLLSNTLVIVVPADSTATLTSAKDLADPKFKKIALGQPDSVPAGIYAKEYLTKIGIWDKVSAQVIPCENVRAALAAVETGNADAGIVYLTDLDASKKVKAAYTVPAAEGPTITYPIALVDRAMMGAVAQHQAAIKKFLAYLSDPASAEVFKKYGFITKP